MQGKSARITLSNGWTEVINMAKTVYPYESSKPGYHAGFYVSAYGTTRRYNAPWSSKINSKPDCVLTDSPIYPTLTEMRKVGLYNLKKVMDDTWEHLHLDIVRYHNKKNVYKTRFVSEYVGSISIANGANFWTDKAGQEYVLNKDGTLGKLVRKDRAWYQFA